MLAFDGTCAPELALCLADPPTSLDNDVLAMLDLLSGSESAGRRLFRDLGTSRDGAR